MATGTIKTIRDERGFGFLVADDGERFFHRSGCEDFDSLTVGQAVTFDSEQSDKGPRATNVKAAAATA